MGENYYELLGVSEDASTDEIESAYRERLKETHPDVSDDEDASERTKRLIDAKETLTDETERQRYDRIGHDAYVDDASVRASTETTTTSSSTQASSDSEATSDTSATTSSSTRSANPSGVGWASTDSGRSRRRSRGRHVRDDPDDGTTPDQDTWRAWNTDRSYAVQRDGDSYRLGGALTSQRAFVMLSTTFVVYPVLLFGALSNGFPLPVNLIVAMCIVLVIAFLQSIPEVGIVVFGVWTVLLPILMFGWLGLEPFTVQTIGALVAVVFPLGLSVLTRIAIRPMSAG